MTFLLLNIKLLVHMQLYLACDYHQMSLLSESYDTHHGSGGFKESTCMTFLLLSIKLLVHLQLYLACDFHQMLLLSE